MTETIMLAMFYTAVANIAMQAFDPLSAGLHSVAKDYIFSVKLNADAWEPPKINVYSRNTNFSERIGILKLEWGQVINGMNLFVNLDNVLCRKSDSFIPGKISVPVCNVIRCIFQGEISDITGSMTAEEIEELVAYINSYVGNHPKRRKTIVL